MGTAHWGRTAVLVLTGFVLLSSAAIAGETPAERARAKRAAEQGKLQELRMLRVKENDKGTASEYAGKWKLRLPAGFEYEVQIKQTDDGLLRMTSEGRALILLGDFACKGGELKLVKTTHERVDDYIWTFTDGRFVLTLDDQAHGSRYLHAVLTRVP